MTGPACDVDLPVAELRIDVGYHFNHLASLHLCRLGVERAVRLVAEDAVRSERESKALHRDANVLRREDFEIPRTGDSNRLRRRLPPALVAPRFWASRGV